MPDRVDVLPRFTAHITKSAIRTCDGVCLQVMMDDKILRDARQFSG
jgi:hypothetical protein